MFLVSIPALQRNATILRQVADEAGCHIVLALKGFSCWKAFPHIRETLDGCCASGLWEGLLARDTFGKHVITYSPAYDEEEIAELLEFTHHLDFNSLSQWFRFRETVMAHPRFISGELKCGLRINPEHSTGETPIYDPCVPAPGWGLPRTNSKARISQACPVCISTLSASKTPPILKPPSKRSMKSSATSFVSLSSPT